VFGFFVIPFEGEAPFSILMRLKEQLAFNDNEFAKYVLNSRVIGKKTIEGRIDIDHFRKIFGKHFKLSNEEWLQKYSLLSQLESYVSPKRYLSLEVYTFKVLKAYGFRYPESSGAYLKYCPRCLSEDYDKYFNYFLRRSHQLIGVYTCDKHETPLARINLSYVGRSIGTLKISEIVSLKEHSLFQLNNLDAFNRLTRNAIYLNDNPITTKNHKAKFINSNYVNNSSITDYRRIALDLKNYYGSFLQELEKIYFGQEINQKFLKNSFKALNTFYDPILCLLLYQMNKELQTYPKFNPLKSIFEEVSPCINNVCTEKGQNVSKLIKIKKWHRSNYAAYYKCPICTMTYSKSYFKSKESTKIRIIDYGSIFLSRLHLLVKAQVPMNQIKQELGIHNVTIERLAVINGFDISYLSRFKKSLDKKRMYRKLFDELLNSGIKISKDRLLEHHRKEFEFIRMYDYAYYYKYLKDIK